MVGELRQSDTIDKETCREFGLEIFNLIASVNIDPQFDGEDRKASMLGASLAIAQAQDKVE